MAICLEAEFEQPLRFAFHFGNITDNIFVKAFLDDMSIDVGNETILILTAGCFLNDVLICLFINILFH